MKEMTMEPKMSRGKQTLLEVGPLLAFFIIYKFVNLHAATGVLILGTLGAVGATYRYTKKIPYIPMVSAILVSLFGGLTLFTGDSIWIKMKPTILYLIFGIILLIGNLRHRGLLKFLFKDTIIMGESAWIELSFRFAIFFLFMAGLNEMVWRNGSEAMWVNFKVFGMLPITLIFTASQIPFLKKNLVE